jgi:hypothetical protein
MVSRLHCFRAVVRQNIMAKGYGGAKLLLAQRPGSRETETGWDWR